MSDNQKWSILQGDALKVLGTFDPNTFDAVITDPPYASGGRTQAEKNKSTARKYSSMGENAPPPFDGDAKDQRSWTRWAAEWLYEARKASKPGAPICCDKGTFTTSGNASTSTASARLNLLSDGCTPPLGNVFIAFVFGFIVRIRIRFFRSSSPPKPASLPLPTFASMQERL
mgnify:CR=1 FL=1